MNKNYQVDYEVDGSRNHWLRVTHNGYQWTALRIDNPDYEIPLIIDVLKRKLNELEEEK
jgi:hypothetical protein